jgi:cryptochrome
MVVVVWLRKCLRLHDAPPLAAAAEIALALKTELLVAFVDGDDGGSRRRKFLDRALADLDCQLTAAGNRLYRFHGPPAETFRQLHEALPMSHLVFDKVPTPQAIREDRSVAGALSGVCAVPISGSTLFDMDVLVEAAKLRGQPLAYNPFVKVIEGLPLVPPLRAILQLPPPPLPGLFSSRTVPLSELTGVAGETAALQRLEKYCGNEAWVVSFSKPNTAPMSVRPSTTALSPYISLGCLSVRHMASRLRAIENRALEQHASQSGAPPAPGATRQGRGKASSNSGPHTKPPQSLLGQLFWREFSHYLGYVVPCFDRQLGNPICLPYRWRRDDGLARRWALGMTGVPVVDAGMRQLRQTGWMHHILRHVVACFLTRGALGLDWELGRDVFEELLLDFDWAINASQWQWLSASALFFTFQRVYHPVGFGKKHDPSGEFVRTFVPELAGLPAQYIHEPWAAPEGVLKRAGVELVHAPPLGAEAGGGGSGGDEEDECADETQDWLGPAGGHRARAAGPGSAPRQYTYPLPVCGSDFGACSARLIGDLQAAYLDAPPAFLARIPPHVPDEFEREGKSAGGSHIDFARQLRACTRGARTALGAGSGGGGGGGGEPALGFERQCDQLPTQSSDYAAAVEADMLVAQGSAGGVPLQLGPALGGGRVDEVGPAEQPTGQGGAGQPARPRGRADGKAARRSRGARNQNAAWA